MLSSVAERTKLSPQVRRIVSVVSERIQSGAYAQGEWLPAERTLAEEFHVSRILIRAAVRELEEMLLIDCSAHRRPIVRSSVSADPGISTASPNRSGSSGSQSIAAWMWPQRDSSGSAAVIQGMQEALADAYRLVLGSATGVTWEQIRASEARFLRQALAAGDVKGIIIGYLGEEQNLPLLEELRAAKIPIVFVDHYPPANFRGDYVGITNRRSAELAVKHLLSLGHRTIAHVSNYDGFSTVTERDEGYRRALAGIGVSVREELVIKDPGPVDGDERNSLEAPLQEMLARDNPPTAIFAVNDVIAYRVIAALTAMNLQVPNDISVVGFDGIGRWLPTQPFLTTVVQPFEEIGYHAVELLLDRIARPVSDEYRHIWLEARLTVHTSTGFLDESSSQILPKVFQKDH